MALNNTALPEEKKPVVFVFSGHITDETEGGALSCTGKMEYEYNDKVTEKFKGMEGGVVFKTFPSGLKIPLEKRPGLAKKGGADLVMEIHHDSVIREDIEKVGSMDWASSRRYGGFSIHIPGGKPGKRSLALAKSIRACLLKLGLGTNHYHAWRQRKVEIEDGIYVNNKLLLLKHAAVPTVLVEMGVIVIPDEEKLVSSEEYRTAAAGCIRSAAKEFLAGTK